MCRFLRPFCRRPLDFTCQTRKTVNHGDISTSPDCTAALQSGDGKVGDGMAVSARSQDLLDRRRRLLGPNVSTFYEEPVHLVKGEGVWVWDADGRKYLDCYNNVPHVGHCHPRVVEAICRQAGTLNTHTRYLHETILDYIERLSATFGEPVHDHDHDVYGFGG